MEHQMTATSSRSPNHRFHGLIVDDAVADGFIASCILRREGYEVTLAKSGMEAVEAATKTNFDFVLMDMRMPNMDGFEATRRIRQLEDLNGRVPIMALTAMDLGERDPRFINAGMDGVMSKPINPNALRVTLSRMKQAEPGPATQLELTQKYSSQDKEIRSVQACVERHKPTSFLKNELTIYRPHWSSFSMEVAFWTALSEICSLERITPDQFIADSIYRHPAMSEATAVQLEVINYFRQLI